MKLLILFYCIYIAKALGVTLPWWAYSISAAVFAAGITIKIREDLYDD